MAAPDSRHQEQLNFSSLVGKSSYFFTTLILSRHSHYVIIDYETVFCWQRHWRRFALKADLEQQSNASPFHPIKSVIRLNIGLHFGYLHHYRVLSTYRSHYKSYTQKAQSLRWPTSFGTAAYHMKTTRLIRTPAGPHKGIHVVLRTPSDPFHHGGFIDGSRRWRQTLLAWCISFRNWGFSPVHPRILMHVHYVHPWTC